MGQNITDAAETTKPATGEFQDFGIRFWAGLAARADQLGGYGAATLHTRIHLAAEVVRKSLL